MPVLLIANTIFEIGIGFVFILFPSFIVKNNELAVSFLRVIGCGAVALGILSFLMLTLKESKELKPGLITLSVFHSLAALTLFSNFTNSITNSLLIIIHLLLGVSFISITWKRIMSTSK
ncbi:MAG: hypothetical protein KME29_17860 [Calothrix sp. FI2-JRJ7]|jgi:hypothetical protein|nr:hypothetical protein [Calothrix sp. FI2-JRJ7]